MSNWTLSLAEFGGTFCAHVIGSHQIDTRLNTGKTDKGTFFLVALRKIQDLLLTIEVSSSLQRASFLH